MRIISGKYKRRSIVAPNNLPVRPTTDMAKESLFNILNNKIDFNDKSALDLFSGTGNISYEFVSRGCVRVVSVDQNVDCTNFINQTTEKLNMPEIEVVKLDVFRYLTTVKNKFDIIFADPPYQMTEIKEISELVFSNNLLIDDGWLIVEHPREIDFSKALNFFEHRKYGRVNFSFFHKQ